MFDFFKNRKRTIYDRTGKIPYLVRWYIFLKDRKSFPFNITLHKVLVSDEPVLHDHPWNWGALIIKGGYWEHTPEGKHWRGPGSLRWRKSDSLHYLELAKDKDGNERFSTGVVANNFGGVQILGGGDNNLDSSSGMNQEPAKKENLDQTIEDDDLPF